MDNYLFHNYLFIGKDIAILNSFHSQEVRYKNYYLFTEKLMYKASPFYGEKAVQGWRGLPLLTEPLRNSSRSALTRVLRKLNAISNRPREEKKILGRQSLYLQKR